MSALAGALAALAGAALLAWAWGGYGAVGAALLLAGLPLCG